MLLVLAVTLSALGMAAHTVREFGLGGLLDPRTGTAPVLLIQGVLLLGWWRVPFRRVACTRSLAAIALVQLVGGAVLTVLPLPILPFDPEQTVGHYVAHAIYGIAQLPLIGLGLAPRRVERRHDARVTVSSGRYGGTEPGER